VTTTILKFVEDENGNITLDGMHQGAFDPTIKAHALLEAVRVMLPDLIARTDGRISDGERYRGMKQFAEMGKLHDEATVSGGSGDPVFVAIEEEVEEFVHSFGEAYPDTDVFADAVIAAIAKHTAPAAANQEAVPG
jgi:hypothetical protein